MTSKPVVISPSSPVVEAAMLMREHDVGSVLVKEDDAPCGILTEWDFVHRVVAQQLDINTTTVADVMVKDLVTVHPGMDIFDALRLMQDADIRHLPVLEQEKIVGFITLKDILRIQPQLFDILLEKFDLGGPHEEY